MNISDEYITKDQAMRAYCEHFCHPGPRCPDGYCREVRDAFGPLESVALDCRNLYDDGYNEGLRAVECMLHVLFKNCPLRQGFGMEKQDTIEVFGTDDYGDIFANYSIKDFLEKTDEWACKKRSCRGGKQMSYAYDEYLAEHIGNVNKGLHWMLDNLGLSQEEKTAIETAMTEFNHDESKYSTEEYDAYDKYFYGGNRSYKVVQDFNYAWLHHIHQNPHHWQYWVLLEDDPETELPYKTLMIPLPYIFEMIADWWSFSWKAGNLFEIFNWYAEHRDKQYIDLNSRMILERILEKIWDVLIMQETVAGHDISEIEGQYRRFWIEQKMDQLNLEHSDEEDHLEHHGILGQKWGSRNGPPYPINSQLKNKTPAEVKEIKNYKGKLYWLSESDMDGRTLIPRVPKNYFTENDYEDNQTPRLCFAPSIGQCLTALSQNVTGKTYTVYEPEEMPESVWKPNKGAVPDSEITGELWVKEPVKLKAVGEIKVTGDDGKDGMKFEYGDHTAELYGWNYESTSKYTREQLSSEVRRLQKELKSLKADKNTDPEYIELVEMELEQTQNDLNLKHSDTEDSDEDLYGVPELKKFPMPDKKHVKSAIRFFNYVDPKYEKELAEAIIEKAEEFGVVFDADITVGDENRLKKYLPKKKEESQ